MEAKLLLSADAPLAVAATGSRRCPSLTSCTVMKTSLRAAPNRWPSVRAYGGLAGHNNWVYTVGDFMTKRRDLHVVKPTTSVDEALEMLVQHRISGFPVIDNNWKLVGVVSDYDLLALDSMAGCGLADKKTGMFPEVDSTWKDIDDLFSKYPAPCLMEARLVQTFREIQRLMSKTNGKVICDLMTHAPLVVSETTNLDAAARLLLETKYHRLPVVDSMGKLVGMITRGNVVRAALKIKKKAEEGA